MPIPPSEDLLIEYPSGPASLFAASARIRGKCTCLEYAGDDPDCPMHQRAGDLCTFCGGMGDGSGTIDVNGYHVPPCHTGCITEIKEGSC